jgi:hypothetical protein
MQTHLYEFWEAPTNNTFKESKLAINHAGQNATSPFNLFN